VRVRRRLSDRRDAPPDTNEALIVITVLVSRCDRTCRVVDAEVTYSSQYEATVRHGREGRGVDADAVAVTSLRAGLRVRGHHSLRPARPSNWLDRAVSRTGIDVERTKKYIGVR
jgi:hypothetical protein